jgi:hypothetical protein
MQDTSSPARQIARQALCDAENAIARGEMNISRQRWVIAATERSGRDAARDRALLSALEHELGRLEEWRQHLLGELR